MSIYGDADNLAPAPASKDEELIVPDYVPTPAAGATAVAASGPTALSSQGGDQVVKLPGLAAFAFICRVGPVGTGDEAIQLAALRTVINNLAFGESDSWCRTLSLPPLHICACRNTSCCNCNRARAHCDLAHPGIYLRAG